MVRVAALEPGAEARAVEATREGEATREAEEALVVKAAGGAEEAKEEARMAAMAAQAPPRA